MSARQSIADTVGDRQMDLRVLLVRAGGSRSGNTSVSREQGRRSNVEVCSLTSRSASHLWSGFSKSCRCVPCCRTAMDGWRRRRLSSPSAVADDLRRHVRSPSPRRASTMSRRRPNSMSPSRARRPRQSRRPCWLHSTKASAGTGAGSAAVDIFASEGPHSQRAGCRLSRRRPLQSR